MDLSPVHILLAIVVGAALGWWFFGGLLWTVRRLPDARHPALLAFFSFFIRTAAVLVVLGGMATQHWLLPIFALVAFVVVRQVIVRSVPRTAERPPAE